MPLCHQVDHELDQAEKSLLLVGGTTGAEAKKLAEADSTAARRSNMPPIKITLKRAWVRMFRGVGCGITRTHRKTNTM